MSNESMSLVEVMSKVEERFLEIAPPGMMFASEQGFAIQLLDNNPYLKKVSEDDGHRSLLQAMSNVAAIGLSLNPAKKQAYLIPRNVKTSQGKWKAKIFLEPSYMGLCDIATGTGIVEWLQAENVYHSDTFEIEGIDKAPTHRRDPFLSKEDRGEYRGSYCVAKLKSGDYLTAVMSAEEVYSVRARSEAWKKSVEKGGQGAGPWLTDFGEQAKKTVVRRAYKMLPKTDGTERLEQAVHISNENEGFEPIINNPQISDYTPDQKQYFDGLITKSDAIGMFCFMRSIEEGVWISLYNSFEKGQKGKYQQVVNGLSERGENLMADIRVTLQEAAESGDDHGARQILEELSQEAIDYILDNVSMEVSSYLRRLMDEN